MQVRFLLVVPVSNPRRPLAFAGFSVFGLHPAKQPVLIQQRPGNFGVALHAVLDGCGNGLAGFAAQARLLVNQDDDAAQGAHLVRAGGDAQADAQLVELRDFIDANYEVEGDLRRSVDADIRRKIEIGTYQGRRHRAGLPVRGQRTRTNARTRKGRKKAVAGKKKAR